MTVGTDRAETAELAGRRMLITGANGGIGRVIAKELASRGASLALVARDEDSLAALKHSLPGAGHDAIALDVRDESKWQENRERIAPQGKLHGIVTAAAVIGPIGLLGTWSVEAFRATLDVNVTGTLLAIEQGLEALRSTKGAVVTFSGGGGTSPFPRFDAYAASKAAVVRLTENLAASLGEDGIRLNAVAPGFVLSAMHEDELAAGPEIVGASYYARTAEALKNNAGDPPELCAELVAFLLSDTSIGISGKLISARWDPWREPDFQERLRHEADLATIRRIDEQAFSRLAP